jgi:hypothetical protein
LLQGALDGGLDIPHSDKRFAGFKKDEKQLDAEIHRKYIYGGHVAEYMRVSCACCLLDCIPFVFLVTIAIFMSLKVVYLTYYLVIDPDSG